MCKKHAGSKGLAIFALEPDAVHLDPFASIDDKSSIDGVLFFNEAGVDKQIVQLILGKVVDERAVAASVQILLSRNDALFLEAQLRHVVPTVIFQDENTTGFQLIRQVLHGRRLLRGRNRREDVNARDDVQTAFGKGQRRLVHPHDVADEREALIFAIAAVRFDDLHRFRRKVTAVNEQLTRIGTRFYQREDRIPCAAAHFQYPMTRVCTGKGLLALLFLSTIIINLEQRDLILPMLKKRTY